VVVVHRCFLRLGQILALVALLATCGGHWAVMQSFAWARMLVANAGVSPLSVAVEKTFDGHHPCAICNRITSEKGKETKQQRTVASNKLVLFFEMAQGTVCILEERAGFPPGECNGTVRAVEPRIQPPRSAAA